MQNEYLKDINPEETNEWLEALENIIEEGGPKRAHYILEKLIDKARRKGTYLLFRATTAYLNSIDVEDEPKMPGDRDIERRIRSAIRWNATMMVLRASKKEFRAWWTYCIISIFCNII